MDLTLKDTAGLHGRAIASIFEIDSDEALYWDTVLSEMQNAPRERFCEAMHALTSAARLTRTFLVYNLVVDRGCETLAAFLAGETTYTGGINYGALGSGITAVSAGDTTLATEVFRKTYASRSRSSKSTTIDYYFSKGDTNGTYNEFGCFIAGTATANSGQLYNRLLTGGWTKSASEAMTVSIIQNVTA